MALYCHHLLLLATIISWCGATEYYVKPTQPANTSCPGQPCLTLNQYTNDSSYYIRSNTVFTFLPGKHIMQRPLEIRDVENVTLYGMYSLLVAEFPCSNELQSHCIYPQYETVNRNVYQSVSLKLCCSAIRLINVVHADIDDINLEMRTTSVSGVIVQQSANVCIQIHIHNVDSDLDLGILGKDLHNIGIVAYESSHLHVDTLQASNLSYGIVLLNTNNTNITHSVIKNSQNSGVVLVKTDMVNIFNTTTSSNMWNGMTLYASQNTVMEQLYSTSNEEIAMLLIYCSNTSIMDISATHNQWHGIALQFCRNTSMMNISTTNNERVAISLVMCTNTIMMNISATHNQWHGITMQSCTNSSMINTSAMNNERVGIGVDSCNNTNVINISATNNQQEGMQMALCINTSMMNISATNNLREGMQLVSCSNTSMMNISATNNQNTGIVLFSCYNTRMMIISATNNQWDGMVLISCNNSSMSGISITNNEVGGIGLYICSNTNIMNSTANNQKTGVTIWKSTNTTTVGISAAHNQNDGMWLVNSANLSINGARVTHNGHNGIFVSQCTVQIILKNNIFSDITSSSTSHTISELQTVPAIIGAENATLILTNCTFTRNNISSIRAIGSKIIVRGKIVFSDNHALSGTAFLFSNSSVLIISEYSTLTFQNNRADNYGGAFYISTKEIYNSRISFQDQNHFIETFLLTSSTECFVQVEGDRSKHRLTFTNNTAGKGGDVVYGGLVALGYDGDWNCLLGFKNISDMSQQKGLSVITSSPSRVCLCYDAQPDCLTVADPTTLTVYPGETVTIPAVVVGQDFGTTTGVLTAEFLPAPYTTCSIDMEKGQWSRILNNRRCESLKFKIYADTETCEAVLVLKTENIEVLRPMTIDDNHKINRTWTVLTKESNYTKLTSHLLSDFIVYDESGLSYYKLSNSYSELAEHTIENFLKFTPEELELDLLTKSHHSLPIESIHNKLVFPKEIYSYPAFINISLRSCPLGFTLTRTPQYKCDCIQLLQKMPQVKCHIQDQTITRDGLVWVGIYGNDTVVASKYCPLSYCQSREINLTLQEVSGYSNHTNTDTQCNYKHSGILCGGCPPGLSLALGSEQCLPCSNIYIFLILPFAMAGVLLVVLIKVLDLTISQGTMNGLIFYANVVSANKYLYYKQTSVNPITLFIAWFNLDIGIELCFFNGLTAYRKTWLQFVFPFYIWGIAGLIIILAKYNDRVARLLGNNGVPVLSTLFLLSYSKLFNTIITALSYTTLHTTQGQVLVWSADGNLDYLGSEHVPLFAVAVATLLFLWLPYTLLLLVGQWLHRVNCHIITCMLLKVKPFLDAHYAAFKDKHRYWFGVLLLARAAILLTSAIVPANNARILEFSFSLCSVLLSFWAQKVYCNSAVGTFGAAFFVNLAFINITKLFANNSDGDISDVSFTVIAIALAQFLGLILYKVISLVKHSDKVMVCVRQREIEDDWELYEQAALEREMESDSDEDKESDTSGSSGSLPTYGLYAISN